MRQVIIAVFVLLATLSAVAQQQLKGRVIDEKGVALSGASVFIRSESKGQVTDRNGYFVFQGLPNDKYQVEVSYVGYETKNVSIPTNTNLSIVLKFSSLTMNELTVTSTRANSLSAVAFDDVKKEEIQQRNLGQDIPYLLALTPSFITTSDAGTGIGYTGFRIRGTDANRTNITVNGVPLNDAESHGTFFVNMPDFASSLSSVQVQRGVGTSTNGASAFGASINMQTEELNKKAYAEISSTLGSFNTNKNTLKAGTGLINNNFAFDARLSNVTSDGYIDRAWVDLKSYYFSAAYLSEKTTIKLLTFGGNEKTYQAWYGIDPETMQTNRTYNQAGQYTDNLGNTQFYDNQTDNYNQTHYQLHWLQSFTDNLSMNMTGHLTRGKGYYEEYKTDRNFVEYGLTPAIHGNDTLTETDLIRQKWLDNYFYGITFSFNYSARNTNISIGGAINRYDGNHFGKVIWAKNANSLDVGKEWYRSKGIKDDANIYAKMNTKLIDNLYASADLQFRTIGYQMNGSDDKYDYVKNTMRDITQNHIYNFFNPKVGLVYKLDASNDFYASYSISNREPNRNNYTERTANEAEPQSERLYDTEAGYRYQSDVFSASANFYYMMYKNQLILTGKLSEIGEPLTTNIDNSYRAGVEISLGVKLTDWLNWESNITLSQNKILNFVESVPVYNADYELTGFVTEELGKTDIAFSPSIIANSLLTAKYNQFTIGLHSNYVGKQFLDNSYTNIRSIDAYFVNNLSAKYELELSKIRAIDFQVLVNNIFNTKYETNGWVGSEYYEGDPTRYDYIGYFPQAGINFLASVTLKF